MHLDREVLRIGQLPEWTDAEAKRVVNAWRRSGESRAAFGRMYGIAVHRLYFWIAKFEKRSGSVDAERTGQQTRFHEVEIVAAEQHSAQNAPPQNAGAPIEIRMIRLPRGFSPEELRAVVQALEA